MGGGIKRNRIALPKGHDRGGDEQQPGDEMVGAWPRQELERMDESFRRAVTAVLRRRDDRGT